MSANSGIEWTHHTFNPWSGCAKISQGCANCYAAALPPVMRRHAEWGVGRDRMPASDAYWLQALAWNRAAIKAGERHRVFCASTADIFEDRADLDPWRDRVMALTQFTRAGLDWLFLTKRPEYALKYLSDPGLYDRLLEAARWWRERRPELLSCPVDNPRQSGFRAWYPNVWIGVSVEDQAAAHRIDILRQINARVRFLSCEPLLGPVDLTNIGGNSAFRPSWREYIRERWLSTDGTNLPGWLHWVIVGGESGRKARPMHPGWVRSIRDQCNSAGVPFFFKQWGEWAPVQPPPHLVDLGIQSSMARVGKREAGRMLDGREWSEIPALDGPLIRQSGQSAP